MKKCNHCKILIYIMVIFLVTFMLCLSFFPLAYSKNSNLNFKINVSDSDTNGQASILHINYDPILADIPEKESITNVEIIQILGRCVLNARRFTYDAFSTLVPPVIGILLFANALLLAYRKFSKNISVIAISIGGHAPPLSFT